MPPAKSLMKEFRASFRRKKDQTPKINKDKEEELVKLAELKESLGEIPTEYNDAHLLSFLRARSLSVKEAIKLFKVDMNMKKLLLLEILLQKFKLNDLNNKYSVSGVIGCDKDGSLVRVMKVGVSDIKGYIHCMSTIEHFKVFLWFIELDRKRQEQENMKNGRNESQITYIIDLANLNITNILFKPVLDTGLMSLKLLQDHYYDIAKSIFIINTPPLFSSVFKLFKAVLQDSWNKKIKIYGGDGYKEDLLKLIDADILPAYLGGNRVDENNDPECKEFIGNGGLIPEMYYPRHFLNEGDEDVFTAAVPAGSSLSIRFPVPCEGTVIHFHFQTKDNDVGIGVYLDKSEDASVKEKMKGEDVSHLEPLVPTIRTQSHLCPELGSFTSWFTGTLVFYLDNTYSWMSSKDITYKVTLERPLQDKAIDYHIRREVMLSRFDCNDI